MGQVSQKAKFVVPQPTNPLKEAIFRLCEKDLHDGSPRTGTELTDESELWMAIRNTVNGTVLPRDAVLYLNGRAVLRFSVSHRHLNSWQAISRSETALDGTPRSARGFTEFVRKACATGQKYRIETDRCVLAPAEPRTGCSCADLMAAFHADGTQCASDDPLDRLKSMAEAIIFINAAGEEMDASGPEDLLHTLRRMSAAQNRTTKGARAHQLAPDQSRRPSCILLPYQYDTKIASAEVRNVRALFVVTDVLVSSPSFRAIFERREAAP